MASPFKEKLVVSLYGKGNIPSSSVPALLFRVPKVISLTFAVTCEDYLRFARDESLSFPDSFLSIRHASDTNDWFDFIFSEVIPSKPGLDSPIILFDYLAT